MLTLALVATAVIVARQAASPQPTTKPAAQPGPPWFSWLVAIATIVGAAASVVVAAVAIVTLIC